MTVDILTLKVVLTPLLIAVVTLIQRRFGGVIGGLIAGLPLTSAPVSVFLAIQYGEHFAAKAAVGSLLGTVAMSVFCVLYARAARHSNWPGSLFIGVVGCLAAIIAVSYMPQDITVASLFAFPALVLLIIAIGRQNKSLNALNAPWWDIPARMVVAATAVVLITEFAGMLGPRWSGLLATIPVFAAVMGVFSHTHGGGDAANAVLRGISIGAIGAAGFFLMVGFELVNLGILLTYLCAVATALVLTAGSHRALRPTVTEQLYSDAV